MTPRRPPPDDPLWQSVTRDVKPLRGRPKVPGKPLPKPEPLPASEPKPKRPPPPIKPPRAMASAKPARLPAIDPKLVKSIRRGQRRIEHRLDLHGRTQAEAHRLLERTLAAARARGQRLILVVTGTGLRRRLEGLAEGPEGPGGGLASDFGGPGVLRRNLSHWLCEPPMADWVLALSPAGPEHGGAGAFYLLIRRAR